MTIAVTIQGSWTIKYSLRQTKAVVNVLFQQRKVIINTCLVVENRTSNEEVGRSNTFCDE